MTKNLPLGKTVFWNYRFFLKSDKIKHQKSKKINWSFCEWYFLFFPKNIIPDFSYLPYPVFYILCSKQPSPPPHPFTSYPLTLTWPVVVRAKFLIGTSDANSFYTCIPPNWTAPLIDPLCHRKYPAMGQLRGAVAIAAPLSCVLPASGAGTLRSWSAARISHEQENYLVQFFLRIDGISFGVLPQFPPSSPPPSTHTTTVGPYTPGFPPDSKGFPGQKGFVDKK